MNASNPSFLVGVVQLPSVAAALTAAGYTVVTGDDYRTAATTIRAALGEHGAFPVIVSDSPWPGLRPWAEKIAADTTVVIVRTPGGDTREFGENTSEVTLPSTLTEILTPAGMGVHPNFGALSVSFDGNVDGFDGVTPQNVQQAVAPAATPAPEVTPAVPAMPVFEDPTPQAPQAAPAAETPAAPAAQPIDDPWADDDAETAVDAFTQSPQPSPVFETPTAPAVEQPAAPVFEDAPVTVTPAAPTYEPTPAPVVETPAAPTVSPLDDPWADETPDAPQAIDIPAAPTYEPVPVTAPVVEAPAAPVAEPVAPVTAPVFETPAAPYPPQAPAAPVNDPFADEFSPVAPAQPQAPVYEAPVQQAPVAPTYEPAPVQAPQAPVQQAPTYAPVAPAAPVAPTYEPVPPVQQAPVQPEYPTYSPVEQENPAAIFENIAAAQAVDNPKAFSSPFIQGDGGALIPVSRHGAVATQETDGADVVFVWAGKGGVGKSSTATALAQVASENGLRVGLVDSNFAQGDIRTFLRIGMASLPSVYNYAVTGDLKQTLISPDMLNAARDVKQEPLLFGLVTAPPPHLADPQVVTPEVYMGLIADLRKICDLVVIDTQIVEAVDSSGMVDRFLIPLMQAGAYGFGVTDLSSAGITNLMARLKRFAALGVPREQQMTFLNRVPHNLPFHESSLTAALGEHSVFLGTSYADSAVPEAQNTAGSPGRVAGFAAFMVAALNRVRPDLHIPEPSVGTAQTSNGKKRFGLFGRKGN